MNKEQFAPCPFCGKSDTLTIGKASDAFSELDDCGDPLPYMHTESYSVVCDSSKPDGPGGCGASGGYFPSEHEAVAAWNRRAEVERLAAQAEPAPAPVGEYPAKALEVVEPVACLVETEWGVMVWPISDIDEAGTYCDEDEFPELLYSAATVSALQARLATQAEHQAKALEGVEPVACLVNADLGAMVWPISDINEAETYCDEGEFPEPLYSATTVSALQARIATQAEHQAKALEGVQAFEFDPPPYNSAAMGCGLEDRGATDIYDAMYYGWHEAMDRAYESIPDDLVSASAVSALQARIAELESELRRVTTSPPTGSAPCARLCEHMAFQIQAKSDARRIAELEQDAVRGEPVGWQPLATAPKDGKEFIVRYPLQMNCKQLVYWNLIHGFWMSKGVAQMGLGNQQAEWHPLPADEPLPKETP